MTYQKRMKASDVFNTSTPVFGKKTTFDKAFPEIADVKVEVTESGEGVTQFTHKRSYSESRLGEYIDCSNPACYNGGFHIADILREMVRNKQADLTTTAICQGHEGSPKGRKIYRKCLNHFQIKVHIGYR